MRKIVTLIFIFITGVLYPQSSPGVYTIKNADVNTGSSDFGTAFYGKDKVVFASPKQGLTFNLEERGNQQQPFLDLFIGEVSKEGGIIKKTKMPGDINTKYHEGVVSFTKDLKTVYFTANRYSVKKKKRSKMKSTVNLQLFKATINEHGEWSNLTWLPFNSDKFSSGHPTLNKDDTKLYFISDRPESIGKTDIYVVDIYEDDTFSEPRNLGPRINTVEREMFPFISDDNVLYFSSDGFQGHGELDVFASKIFDSTVSDPINLEGPVNSNKDDFAYIINDTNNKGYFSSNRNGGSGDDDIYSFTAAPPIYIECKQIVSGFIKDKNTFEIVPKALMVLFDEENKELQKVISDEIDGSFSFEPACDADYTIRGYIDGYLVSEMEIKTVNDLDVGPLEVIMHADMDEINKINANLNEITDLNTGFKQEADLNVNSGKNKEEEELADKTVATDLKSNTNSDLVSNEQTDTNANAKLETNNRNKEKSGVETEKNSYEESKIDKTAKNVLATSADPQLDPEAGIKGDDNLEGEVADLRADADQTANGNLEGDKNDNIKINTIYFDFDKSNIRYDAQLELDKIADILMEYPQMKIEINSHTDSRGKNSYNLKLSNYRAESTIQYLVNKGVETKRVSGKGYGELQLAENCPNGVPCTGLQHQLNRRSEFSIFKNGSNDITFRSSNISNTVNTDNNRYTLNSGEFVNYNFNSDTKVYTVQVGAFQGMVQTHKYSKLSKLFNHRYNDGFNRYYVGIFETSTEARNHMKLLRQKGFEGAFVVGLDGNGRF